MTYLPSFCFARSSLRARRLTDVPGAAAALERLASTAASAEVKRAAQAAIVLRTQPDRVVQCLANPGFEPSSDKTPADLAKRAAPPGWGVWFRPGTPGQGHAMVQTTIGSFVAVNLMGRVFMNPADCPFRAMDSLLASLPRNLPVIVDFHAEATSEKIAMGHYLDGRVAAVFGTHTHVQTNDARILPDGTGYLTDAGMTGAYDSILGVEKEIIIQKFLTQLPIRHEVPEKGRKLLSGCYVEINDQTGKCVKIENIVINEDRPFGGEFY